MVTDDQKKIREKGIKEILKIKVSSIKTSTNAFVYGAKNQLCCTKLLRTHSLVRSNTPITNYKINQNKELKDFFKNYEKMEISQFPYHTQAVEKRIKLVTDVFTSVVGPKRRDGFIRARFLSRQETPKFETKTEYFMKTASPEDDKI